MALSAKDLRGKLVGVCVSGGLDSKTVSKRLVEEGVQVLAFSADLGQPDEDDIQNVCAPWPSLLRPGAPHAPSAERVLARR